MMLRNKKPLAVLPTEIQQKWRARLMKAQPTNQGVFELIDIRPTEPYTWQEGKLIALVLDENGIPLPGINIAFAYDTADPYIIGPEWEWTPIGAQPKAVHRAHIVSTEGSGQIEEVQGSPVKQGEMGGMTVWVHTPKFSSDIVIGVGALHDHTGLYMTWRLRRWLAEEPQKNIFERVADIEERLAALESR